MPRQQYGHGIPELPLAAQSPGAVAIRNAVIRIQGSLTAPQPVTNLRVTPVAFGNIIDFTRSDADTYNLLWNTTANSTTATVIPLGDVSRYSHNIAKDGIKIFYWIQAVKNGQLSAIVGAKFGVTLGSAVATTVPPPPLPNSTPVGDIDRGVGRPAPPGVG